MASFVLLPANAAGAEEETHLFNATLSLTGNCSTSTLDPVPDPGCPGGAHPPKPLTKHGGVAVDRYGNRYVASAGGSISGSDGRIDVFKSSGEFITEIPVTLPEYQASLAVDSQGYLYVGRRSPSGEGLLRYKPTKYNPAAGDIEYSEPPIAVPHPTNSNGAWNPFYLAVTVDPADNHLFVAAAGIFEFSSAAEGNGLVETLSLGGLVESGRWVNSIALDSVRKRIYLTDLSKEPTDPGRRSVVKVFDLEAPHEMISTIDGSATPTERFVSETRVLPLAVDEESGHVFIGDLEAPTRRVYEFDEGGAPVSTIEGNLQAAGVGLLQLAYDDSPTSPTEGFLFVPSGNSPGHSLAFEPIVITESPIVEGLSVDGVAADEAILQGTVNPRGEETAYRIEYTTEQAFLNEGFEGALLAGEGTLKPGGDGLAVSAPVSGLSPGTSYRFRIVAESESGEDEADRFFATYPFSQTGGDCPNQLLRTGLSALLPDCRAYELATPADTNGHPPFISGLGPIFPSRLASPDGNAVSFQAEGGLIPGTDGTGGFLGDPYLATRGENGWGIESAGPNGAFIQGVAAGSSSPDQGYLAWLSNGPGPALVEGRHTAFVRYPDGHSEPIGQGSLATQPNVRVGMIAENASHLIFGTQDTFEPARQLEPNAPPDGTAAVYDRTGDGVLHVVSLLPGNLTPAAGQSANLQGASLDGEGVAFEIGNTLYLRYDNEATFEIGENVDFAGLAEGGQRIFYVKEGNLEAFDAVAEATIEFSQTGDVTPVNVGADGSAAYLVSPSVLTGESNPAGDTAQPGESNLYFSREGQISFVGTLSQRDVEGVPVPSYRNIRGLGLWLEALAGINWGALAVDPSRATADGDVLLFESNAALTGYDPEGHTQVYRYDASANTLRCLSCNPTGASDGDAILQSLGPEFGALLNAHTLIDNLSADGGRAFFESTEALVLEDTDGLRDVYQWEEDGIGSCQKAGGCVSLISSGASGRDDHLYAVSDSGNDVFVRTADLLLPATDSDETPSIYDARVGGGFAPPSGPAGECLGEACQPAAVAPNDPTPSSSSFEGKGNVVNSAAPKPRCPKGKVRKGKKQRCVAKKSRKHQHSKKRSGAKGRSHR